MYHEHFGLTEAPFELCTDPRFLYLSPAHARARAYLDYAVYKGDGLVVITGEIGVGKSLLIHDITEREHGHSDVIAIRQPQADTVGFLQSLLIHCGRQDPPTLRAQLVAAAQRELAQRFMWGRRTTLIVDEAQKLGRDVLETLRMLADRQVGTNKPLAIVLVGQPCLRARLAGEDMEQFRQRVRLAYHLEGLDAAGTGEYIHRRLLVAGAPNRPQRLVGAEAVQRIYRYTGGVPRLINVLTDMALTAAYLDNATRVSLVHVDRAIDELGWVSFRVRQRHADLAMPGTGAAARARRQWARTVDGSARLARYTGEHLARARKAAVERAWPWSQRAARALWARVPPRARRAPLVLATRAAPLWRRTRTLASGAAATLAQRIREDALPVKGAAVASLVFVAALGATSALFDDRARSPDAAIAALPAPTAIEATLVLDADTPATGRTDYLLLAAGPRAARNVVTPLSVEPAQAPLSASALAYFDAFVPVNEPALVVAEPLPGLLNAKWLLSQDPDAYVIQVLAAKKRDVVDRFLDGQGGALDLAWYRRVRDAQNWYVLVSGVYPDYASARRASEQLPLQVRKTKPWIRPLAKVHDDIRAAMDRRPSMAAL